MLIVPVDDYSPIYCGDTGNPFSIFVVHKNGFQSILDSTITMHMQDVDNPAMIKTCNGVWDIDPSDNGRATYTYQPSDVDTSGSWYMWVKIVLANGGVIHPDDGTGSGKPKILVINPLPSGV
jgi:hypothetical protein